MSVLFAVNGTLMRGLELNQNLIGVGGEFVREAQTQPHYRLWSIGDRHPAMLRVSAGGAAIALEIWRLPLDALGQILLQEPPDRIVAAGMGRPHHEDIEAVRAYARAEGQRVKSAVLPDGLKQGRKLSRGGEAQRLRIAALTEH